MKDVYPKLVALVPSDEVRAGYNAGQIAATLLPKGRTANIAIVEDAHGYPTIWQTTQGFKDRLDKACIKYRIVAPKKGESVCQNMLTAHHGIDQFFNQARPSDPTCC